MMKVFIILFLTQFIHAEPMRPIKNVAGNSSTHEEGFQSSRWNAEDANAVTGPNRQAALYDAETGLKYGCYLTYCWRSCKKGEQIVKGKDLCSNNEWCYSDLGICTYASGCKDAVKLQCYGYGYEPGHIKKGKSPSTPCPPLFDGYLCDTKTERSFGCDQGAFNTCWRSCYNSALLGEEGCNYSHGPTVLAGYKGGPAGSGWCFVPGAGKCSKSSRCIFATQIKCGRLQGVPLSVLFGLDTGKRQKSLTKGSFR